MPIRNKTLILLGGWIGVVFLAGCQATERAAVSFSYAVEPERGLPEGMETIAILPAKIGPTTDEKWSDLCATVLNSLVNESRSRFGTQVVVTDRRDVQVTFDEADLAAAGLSTRTGGTGGQLLAADGVILSNINVKVEKHVGKDRTIAGFDIGALRGRHVRGGRAAVHTEEVETVTRHMTVQTEFKLVDSSNNRVWAHYSPRPYSATDRTKVSPLFGAGQTEAALTPQDRIIGTLVERAAREFISQIMHCRIDVDTIVFSSSNPDCIQGVRLLRAGLYQEARSSFASALAANPNDHRAAYGTGVASEALGRFDDAKRYYQQALVAADVPEYQDALARVKMYGHRAGVR